MLYQSHRGHADFSSIEIIPTVLKKPAFTSFPEDSTSSQLLITEASQYSPTPWAWKSHAGTTRH